MCLIIAKPRGVKIPPRDYFKNAESNNAHGVGLCYAKNKHVYIKKDFKGYEDAYEFIVKEVGDALPCIVHFRLATSGLKDVGNRHPFPITSNVPMLRKPTLICKRAVAHNGILSKYSGHKKLSDTQKFVSSVLAKDVVKNNLHDQSIQLFINNFIDGDKLAVLEYTGELILFGKYTETDGVFYSNDGYLARRTYEYWTPTSYNGEYSIDTCDACDKKKSVKSIIINGVHNLLCKKCRKRLKRGSLDEDVKRSLGVGDEGLEQCQSCLEWVDKSRLFKSTLGDVIVCEDCHDATLEDDEYYNQEGYHDAWERRLRGV